MFGIELDKFDAQAHDGKGYFQTQRGYGHAIFVTVNDIKKSIPMELETFRDHVSEDNCNITVGDRLRLHNARTGILRWIGILNVFQDEQPMPNTQLGIELDVSDLYGNDGHYGDTKYFDCRPNHGVFVTSNEIDENLGNTQNQWSYHKYTISGGPRIILNRNMRVQTLIGGSGVIRYIGPGVQHPTQSHNVEYQPPQQPQQS
eukprot:142976_1